MKKFHFPLERVRQYRKLQMETEQAKLDECAARLRSIEQMEDDLRRQKFAAEQEIRTSETRREIVPTQELAAWPAYRGQLLKVAGMLVQRRIEAQNEIARQRAVLLEARRRYEMLEKAKDRLRLDWKVRFAREQEALASELFLARWRSTRTASAGKP